MKRLFYILALLLLLAPSCREFHASFVDDQMLAEVDGKRLMQSELQPVVPKEYKGEDSVAFVEVYIDKWIRRQVKLREAERQFFNSQLDIEAMVKDYKELLLIRRLDERQVAASIDTTYTESQIAQYYINNSSNFRLNRDIVKGEVLRVPLGSDQTKKLTVLMASPAESKRQDMLSICEKNGFEFTDLSLSWVEATRLLDLLPLVRSDEPTKFLSPKGVNHMKDDNFDYYYQIFDHAAVGDVAPLEWVRSTIRTILVTERQQAIIRDSEQELYSRALLEGVIKRGESKSSPTIKF